MTAARGNHTESGETVLDGNGNGTIKLRQVPVYRVRRYVRMTVSIDTDQQSVGGTVKIYAGEPLEVNFIDGSETPWLDTATWELETAVLRGPLQLTALFTDCDPNANARLDVTYIEETL